MLPDQSQGNPQQVDPRLLMQMLMARRAQAGAIPGAASPQGQASGGASATQNQGGVPGAVSAPPPQAPPSQAQGQSQSQSQSQSQGGPASQLSPVKPASFTGTFGTHTTGLISTLVNSAEKRAHDKKVNEAEMYYNQINSFLASGKPEDTAKAHQILDDPKVRKILKAGLDYVPLEDAPPPEAIGIHQAQQKIDKKQSTLQQIQRLLSGGRQQGNAQQRPPGRAIIPGPSQAAVQAQQLGEAKVGEQEALAQQHRAEAGYDKTKADAELIKANADAARVEVERQKATSAADEAKAHATLYEKQAKELGDTNPERKNELRAHANLMNAEADWNRARSKYAGKDKMPSSALQSQIKSARGDMVSLLKGYISDNKDAAKAVSKDTGYLFGPRSGLVNQQQSAAKQAKNMSAAIAWFDGEGTTNVTNGKMTLPEAVRKAYQMAGIESPVPSMGPTEGNQIPGFTTNPDGSVTEN